MVTRGKTINHKNPQRIEVDLSKQTWNTELPVVGETGTSGNKEYEHLLCFVTDSESIYLVIFNSVIIFVQFLSKYRTY